MHILFGSTLRIKYYIIGDDFNYANPYYGTSNDKALLSLIIK